MSVVLYNSWNSTRAQQPSVYWRHIFKLSRLLLRPRVGFDSSFAHDCMATAASNLSVLLYGSSYTLFGPKLCVRGRLEYSLKTYEIANHNLCV